MRFATSLTLLTIVAVTGPAYAGAALDDDKKASAPAPTPTTDPAASPDNLATIADKVEYGVQLKVRSIYIPRGLLELFVDRAAGGTQNYGYGIDFVRRRDTVELHLGFEYEHINAAEGVWIKKGDTVPTNVADYILSPEHSGNQFGWLTIEFTFVNHVPFNKYVAFRYGLGAGLGIITGELNYYKLQCAAGASNANPEPGCVPPRFGGTGTYTDINGNVTGVEQKFAYSTPPVFPAFSAFVGLQFKPLDKMVVNIEGGFRAIPILFLGASVGYFF